MDHAGIDSAIVVGHSFGGALAATFALDHPRRVEGLVFLAAATHPWPGGATSWYYQLTARPVVGRIFANALAYPGGILRMRQASICVFSPNPAPEAYLDDAGIALVLRPGAFRANAVDVNGLFEHVRRIAPRYREISVPTVVVSGNRDTVVYEEIHSTGLARDIPDAELVWVDNLGHKPDWIASDLVVAAIEKVAGRPRDLQALARNVEARIRGDAYGVGVCVDEKPALNEVEAKPDG
jgi:pimeloyl-ACP methyl ester carboxylesterase